MTRNGTACRRPPSAPRTYATASGSSPTQPEGPALLLPTPSAVRYGTNQDGSMGRTGPVRPSLDSMARQAAWPTPTARLGSRRQTGPLLAAARYFAGRRRDLDDAVAMWPSPTASDSGGGQAHKRPPSRLGSPLLKEITPGPLNPAWVEALMGFPPGWTALP
jgi:hypothetical protein